MAHGGKGRGEGRAAVKVSFSFLKGEREGAEPPRIKAGGLGCRQAPQRGEREGAEPPRIKAGGLDGRQAPQRGEREGAAAPSHKQGGSEGAAGPPSIPPTLIFPGNYFRTRAEKITRERIEFPGADTIRRADQMSLRQKQ